MGDESPPEVPAPAEVEPGLWTCAEVAVPAALADASLGITHLVSIGCPPPDDPTGGVRTVETLRLDLEDEDDGDLLTQIPDTVAFIRGGLSARQRGSPPGETSGDGAADAPDAKSVGGVLATLPRRPVAKRRRRDGAHHAGSGARGGGGAEGLSEEQSRRVSERGLYRATHALELDGLQAEHGG